VVGVDLGIKSLAVLSTCAACNGKPRAVPARTAVPGSGPRSGGARPRPASRLLHTAVANARRDGLHQLSTRLVREHRTIVIEDLHVAGMLRNRRLTRRVAGVGIAKLRRQIRSSTKPAGPAAPCISPTGGTRPPRPVPAVVW
jgi:putative transposase